MTSKGAKALMDEIRKAHYSTEKKTPSEDAVKKHVAEPKTESLPRENGKTDSDGNCQVVRRRRTRKSANPTDLPVIGPTFTMTVIGGIGIPDYPLSPGERLAIVKLTPVKIAT